MFVRDKNLIVNLDNVECIREVPGGLAEVVCVSGRTYTFSAPKLRRRLLNAGRGALTRLVRWVLGL